MLLGKFDHACVAVTLFKRALVLTSYFIFVQINDAPRKCQIPMEEGEDVKAGRGEREWRMIHLISILQHCCRISNKFTPHSVVLS